MGSTLYDILIFLGAAILVVTLVRRFLKSPIIGYLLAGLLIGPFGLGLIDEVAETQKVAELGVVFLLFTIGLDLSWARIIALKTFVFGLGGLQVLLTTLSFIFFGTLVLDLSLSTAILIGSGLALSSTAVVIQILKESDAFGARYGRVSFSILLFQDLAVVLFLVLIPVLSSRSGALTPSLILASLGLALMKALFVLTFIAVLGRIFVRPLYRFVANTKNSELFVATTLLVILLIGYATEVAGLSMELGAFLAGLLLAETEYRHQVESDIHPFRGLLLGLFFMSVGMGINLHLLGNHFFLILQGIVGLLVGKAAILIILALFFRTGWLTAIRMALLLAAGGEFAFVLFAQAYHAELFSAHTTQILNLVVTLSMALIPFLDFLGIFCAKFFKAPDIKIDGKAIQEEVGNVKNHVIIVGHGRVGQIISRLLSDHLIPYVAIDMNLAQVSEGKTSGLPVFFGDARRADIFQAVGAERAKAIVLTMGAPGTLSRIVMTLKRNFPGIPIFVRARDIEHAEKLEKAGAYVIVPELIEPSLQLATAILILSGIPKDAITKSIETIRHTLWTGHNLNNISQMLEKPDEPIQG